MSQKHVRQSAALDDAQRLPLREAAPLLAAAGWPVYPCLPVRKAPLVKHGLHEATTDATVVARWWSRWPEANIATPTGAKSGFDVVDVDVREARRSHRHWSHPLSLGPLGTRAAVGRWLFVVGGGLHLRREPEFLDEGDQRMREHRGNHRRAGGRHRQLVAGVVLLFGAGLLAPAAPATATPDPQLVADPSPVTTWGQDSLPISDSDPAETVDATNAGNEPAPVEPESIASDVAEQQPLAQVADLLSDDELIPEPPVSPVEAASGPAARAALVLVVDSLGSEPAAGSLTDGVCRTGAGTCTLRAAIQEANALNRPRGEVEIRNSNIFTAPPGPQTDCLGLAGGGCASTPLDAPGQHSTTVAFLKNRVVGTGNNKTAAARWVNLAGMEADWVHVQDNLFDDATFHVDGANTTALLDLSEARVHQSITIKGNRIRGLSSEGSAPAVGAGLVHQPEVGHTRNIFVTANTFHATSTIPAAAIYLHQARNLQINEQVSIAGNHFDAFNHPEGATIHLSGPIIANVARNTFAPNSGSQAESINEEQREVGPLLVGNTGGANPGLNPWHPTGTGPLVADVDCQVNLTVAPPPGFVMPPPTGMAHRPALSLAIYWTESDSAEVYLGEYPIGGLWCGRTCRRG